MRVFISWSGERSQRVADVLSSWLKSVIQSTEPFISTEMERGERWLTRINSELGEHSLGVVCVTPDNTQSPWLNFEAGALSNRLGDPSHRLIPYLIGFESPTDLGQPLSQFNVAMGDKSGTLDLVRTLNRHAEYQLDDTALVEQFKVRWPILEAVLAGVSNPSTSSASERRSIDEKVDEILALVRRLDQGDATTTDSGIFSAFEQWQALERTTSVHAPSDQVFKALRAFQKTQPSAVATLVEEMLGRAQPPTTRELTDAGVPPTLALSVVRWIEQLRPRPRPKDWPPEESGGSSR